MMSNLPVSRILARRLAAASLVAVLITALSACGTKTPLIMPPGPAKPPLLGVPQAAVAAPAKPPAAAPADDSAAAQPR